MPPKPSIRGLVNRSRSRSNSPKTRRDRCVEDVPSSTSLPPCVDGPLRSLLKFEVPSVLLYSNHPREKLAVRVKWWGESESSHGTLFRPKFVYGKGIAVDNIALISRIQTTALFPVKSAPKQMVTYLRDMSVLHLELVKLPEMDVIGRCSVPQITQLDYNNPISGSFAMFASDATKIADVKISLAFRENNDGSQRLDPTRRSQEARVQRENRESGILEVERNYPMKQPHVLQQFIPNDDAKENSDHVIPKSTNGDSRESVDDLIAFLLQRGANLREVLVQSEETDLGNQNLKPGLHTDFETDITVSNIPDSIAREVSGEVPLKFKTSNNETENLVSSSLQFHDLVYKFDKKRLETLAAKTEFKTGLASDGSVSHDDLKWKFRDNVNCSSDSDGPLRDSSIIKRVLDKNGIVLTTSNSSATESSDGAERSSLRGRRRSKKGSKKRLPRFGSSGSSGSSVDCSMEILKQQERLLLEELNSESKFNRPNFEDADERDHSKESDLCLSVDRYNLIQNVSKALVVIDSFSSSQTAPGLKLPPKAPFISKHAEYVVEFDFPSCLPRQRIELKRVSVACRSVNTDNRNILFSHRSVFPLSIGGGTKNLLHDLWDQVVTIHLYLKSAKSLAPKLVGSGAFKLAEVIQADFFSLSVTLPLKKFRFNTKRKRRSFKSDSPSLVGNLKLTVELTADQEGFPAKLNELKIKEAARIKPVMIKLDDIKSRPVSSHHEVTVQSIPELQVHHAQLPDVRVQREHSLPVKEVHKEVNVVSKTNVADEGHSLMDEGNAEFFFISIGQASLEDSVAKRHACLNLYTVARVFFLEDWIKSDICWGSSSKPHFNVCYTVPFVLSHSVLQRLKNNYVVVEVWNKLTSAGNDELVGLIKIPTSQIYLSFTNDRMIPVLKEAHYPVVAGDTTFPIIHPTDYTCKTKGTVAITVAVGTAEQVAALKHVKSTSDVSFVDKSIFSTNPNEKFLLPSKELDEHSFEVMITGLKNFNTFSDDVHGEADCFVQYVFPDQDSFNFYPQTETSSAFALRKFKTSPTLCVPNALFHDVIHHKLIYPVNLSLPNQLLQLYSAQTSKSLTFEVWTRHYHPNLRDQLVATCVLPLPKLCSLVTMHSHAKHQLSCQTFILPLSRNSSGSLDRSSKPGTSHCGVLEATISYKVSDFGSVSTFKGLGMNTQVVLRINVVRACGLEEAALIAAENHPELEYYSKVGLNTYFKISLSFCSSSEARKTRTVAQSFAPETGSVMEIPLSVYYKGKDNSQIVSLAEQIEANGECYVEMWHQHSPSKVDGDTNGKKQDVLIASTTILLADLLNYQSGIRGWWPLNPVNEDSVIDKGVFVGGVDLQIGFSRAEDREKVIHAGRGCGWKESFDAVSALVTSQPYRLTVCFTELNCVRRDFVSLITNTRKSVKCYVRYKFYDKAAVCTHSFSLKHLGNNSYMAKIEYREAVCVEMSEPLKHYLKEEPLELQIWLVGDAQASRGKRRDKYLGSAYLPMESLTKNLSLSTVNENCIVYKPGASYLGVVQLRASVTLEQSSSTGKMANYDEDVMNSEESSDEIKEPEVDLSSTFKAFVEIERGYHLNLKETSLAREVNLASVNSNNAELYFTFQMTDGSKPISSNTISFDTCPVWKFETETYLDYDYLESGSFLMLKLWMHFKDLKGQKDAVADKVFGFVAVDLTPLNSGFSQVSGYYNVTNFSNQSLGQVKLSVTPMDGFKPRPKPSSWKTAAKSLGSQGQSSAQNSEDPIIWPETSKKAVDTSFSLNLGLPPVGVGFSNSTVEELKRHLDELETVKENLRKKVATQLKQADVLLQKPHESSEMGQVVSTTKASVEVHSFKEDASLQERPGSRNMRMSNEQLDSQSFGFGDEQRLENVTSYEHRQVKNKQSGGFGDRFYTQQTNTLLGHVEPVASGSMSSMEISQIKLNDVHQSDFGQSYPSYDKKSVMSSEFDLGIQLPVDNEEEAASEAFSDSRVEDEDRHDDVNFPQEDDLRVNHESDDNSSIIDVYPSSQLVSITAELSARSEDIQEHSQEVVNSGSSHGKASSILRGRVDNEMSPIHETSYTNLELSAENQERHDDDDDADQRTITHVQEGDDVRIASEGDDEDPGRDSELTTFRQLNQDYNDEELLPYDDASLNTVVDRERKDLHEEQEEIREGEQGEPNFNSDDITVNENDGIPESSSRNGGIFSMGVFSPMTSVDVEAQNASVHISDNAKQNLDETPEVVAEYEEQSGSEEGENMEPVTVNNCPEPVRNDQNENGNDKRDNANDKKQDRPSFATSPTDNMFPNREIEAIEIPMSDHEDVYSTKTYTLSETEMQTTVPPPVNTFVDNHGVKISAASSSVRTRELQGTGSKTAPEAKTCPSIEEAKRIARIFSTKYS